MMCFFSINIHWLLGFNENLQKQDVHNENKHSMFISQSHYHCHVSKGSAPQVGRAPQQDAPRRPLMPVRCKGLQRKVRKVGHFIQTLSPNCPFQTLFQGKKNKRKTSKQPNKTTFWGKKKHVTPNPMVALLYISSWRWRFKSNPTNSVFKMATSPSSWGCRFYTTLDPGLPALQWAFRNVAFVTLPCRLSNLRGEARWVRHGGEWEGSECPDAEIWMKTVSVSSLLSLQVRSILAKDLDATDIL